MSSSLAARWQRVYIFGTENPIPIRLRIHAGSGSGARILSFWLRLSSPIFSRYVLSEATQQSIG